MPRRQAVPHGQPATALGHVDPLHSDMIYQACDIGRRDRAASGWPGAGTHEAGFSPRPGLR